MPAKGVCLHAENLSLALLFLIGRHFLSNQKRLLFSLSRFYKRSQLYILYSDDSLDKCQTKSFEKYETSASGKIKLLVKIEETKHWENVASEFCAFASIKVAYLYVKINKTFNEMIALDLLVLIKIGHNDWSPTC